MFRLNLANIINVVIYIEEQGAPQLGTVPILL